MPCVYGAWYRYAGSVRDPCRTGQEHSLSDLTDTCDTPLTRPSWQNSGDVKVLVERSVDGDKQSAARCFHPGCDRTKVPSMGALRSTKTASQNIKNSGACVPQSRLRQNENSISGISPTPMGVIPPPSKSTKTGFERAKISRSSVSAARLSPRARISM